MAGRQTDRRWWTLPAFLAAGALLVGVSLDTQIRLDAMHGDRGTGYRLLYLPNGRYLKTMALGFPQLLADGIYLWSIQYYSEPDRIGQTEYLEHIFSGVLAELDPQYLDPYMTGAMIMSMEAGDTEMALRLLDKGIRNNPDNWILPTDAGFYAYLQLGDHQRAAGYFERAAARPGAPAVLDRLRAGMFARHGARQQAYLAWLEIYDTAENDYVRTISFRHVHDLKIEIDLDRLQRHVAAWRDRTGVFPDRLERLVEAGALPTLPTDPRQHPYRYDPVTGRVSCRTPFALKRGA